MNKQSSTLMAGKGCYVIDASKLLVAIKHKTDSNIRPIYLDNAQILVNLFSILELDRYYKLTKMEALTPDVLEDIAKEKVVEVVGYEDYEILFLASYAGLPEFILSSIEQASVHVVQNTEQIFGDLLDNHITFYERLAAIAANRLNIPYLEVSSYPVSEVLRLYAICAASFPDIRDLREEELMPEGVEK